MKVGNALFRAPGIFERSIFGISGFYDSPVA
jgi:hypothetical protein